MSRRPSPPAVWYRGGRHPNLWIGIGLVLLTTAVYAPVRHHEFLLHDDSDYVTENPHVIAGLTPESIVWAWTSIHAATWHPITSLSHMLDCQLFGLDPGPPHLVNLLLHILNTVLLFGVLAKMTGNRWPSAFVAALFALHPVHVESVAWVSERKDVLSAFFWMLTLWAYASYVRQRRVATYTLLLLSFAAALLSKPMVVTLPGVLLLLDVWPLRRVQRGRVRGFEGSRVQGRKGRKRVQGFEGSRVQGREDQATFAALPPRPMEPSSPRTLEPLNPRTLSPEPMDARTLLIEKLPLFVLAGVISGIAVFTQRRVGAVVPLAVTPWDERAALVVLAYGGYLRKLLWPSDLAAFYPYQLPLLLPHILGAALLLAVITAVVWRSARQRPYLVTGWLWYLVTLAPVAGLVRFGGHSMADRYTYLPSIGLCIMVAWGVPDLLRRWAWRQPACAVAGGLVVAMCAALTAVQVRLWHDTLTLFQHALTVTRDNYVAHFCVGAALLNRGAADQALPHFFEAIRIAPDYAAAHYNAGLALAQLGDSQGAMAQYEATLRIEPQQARAHNNLGLLLAVQGDRHAAVAHYLEALRIDPGLAPARTNLAVALQQLGDADGAIAQYTELFHEAPQDAERCLHLAAALATAGRFEAALAVYRDALQLPPHPVDARYGLVSTLEHLHRPREAMTELEALLHEEPDAPPVLARMAGYLATAPDAQRRDGPRAVRLAEHAAQLTSLQDPDVLNQLAAAYAEVGRFADAVGVAEQALEQARATGQTPLATAINERLTGYRSAQPAREELPVVLTP